MNPMAIMWAVLLVAFVAVEAFTVSMVSVWFAFGAVGAMIASLLGAELWLQVAVFVAVSAVFWWLCGLSRFERDRVTGPRDKGIGRLKRR